ncbi:MAG TPA: cytochrome c-type biogenesis CcmF C-terminal domain-containing protein [Vicinamibacterales bacterium]|nr:cytochrome c-type biogenesis CcmF C-terminal domain-containing protein [Vicinamibacterales bacterium]
MASLGYYLLLAAFVVCAYAAAISVAGARRRSQALIESGIGAFYLLTAIMGVASAVIVYAFVVGDYSIRYVQRYSDSVQPMFYKLTSYWGGLDGSIMFWVSLLAAFGSAAVYVNRERHRELIPYVVTVISVVEMFFLFLMIVHNNPFQTFLTETHTDGAGLNPLLQNFYMAIHPPTMYLGFVGLTIPYAFGMAALITGHLDDSWLRAVRRWTMISWLFLSVGLGLGMIWAYEELGWGGYWMWDPVENAGLLPWFTATAFLHSVMVQEKRGMLRVWNVCLVITTFFLTIFGTFMTRSGVVQSVHAFGDDPELARLFTIFMITLVVVSFGFVIYRLPLLRARNELDSWLSREAAFMMNNWILLFSAFFVLFATMFPTLSEAIRGERLTVGPPFFNQWMLPIGLTLLLLTGIGPLLAWRKSTVLNLRDSFLFPVAMGLLTGAAVVALGVRVWASGICFALSAFVVGTICQEFWRGARVRQRATGTDVFTALVGLVGRNKRRYGGYVVHLGMVLIFFGFAGEGFKQKEEAQLKPGQQVAVGDFVVRHDALSVTDDGQKQMITAHVTVLRDGKPFAEMYPAKWIFRKHEESPTTEVAINRGFAQDVYLVLATFDAATQSASLAIDINPLVNWVWMGFGLLALGIGIALLPDAAFAFATAPMPANAATTALIFLAVVLSQGVVLAQETIPAVFRSPIERRVAEEVMCTCGCRLSVANCGMMNCHGKESQLAKIHQYAAAGQDHDAILATFVREHGGHDVLMRPPNRGFNRVVWLLPYGVAVMALLGLAATARRWSRRDVAAPAAAAIEPEIDARLENELRDLD